MPLYTLEAEQKLPASHEIIWDFISSPKNLKVITPNYMGFEITSKNLPEKMYAGMIIGYKVSPLLGIKMNWVTEITKVKELEFFIDEQRIGPYKLWHHQHMIKEITGGILMMDIVNYQPPFGFLGAIINSFIIKKQLNEIFNFRKNKMEELFGKMI